MGLWREQFEALLLKLKLAVPSSLQFPELDMKELPKELKYLFLGDDKTFPVIISSPSDELQESKLKKLLRQHKGALGWTIADLKGINAAICTHRIFLEDDARPLRQIQRRLNPTLQEVVKKEVLKLLDVGIIYPISNSKWVSLTQVVPKKAGITIIPNSDGELIPDRKSTRLNSSH